MIVINVLVALLATAINAERTAGIQVIGECPSKTKPVAVPPYCVPQNFTVTHVTELSFAPICGDRLCPWKIIKCPIGFVDGEIAEICVKRPCGGPGEPRCPVSAPTLGLAINKNVLATLVG